jgi:hypothetical protein
VFRLCLDLWLYESNSCLLYYNVVYFELNLKPIMSICLQNAVCRPHNQEICCGKFYCTSVGVRELSLEKRGVHGKKSLKTAGLDRHLHIKIPIMDDVFPSNKNLNTPVRSGDVRRLTSAVSIRSSEFIKRKAGPNRLRLPHPLATGRLTV